ncbi:MAG TPA: PP2C family protein-serine/threonine phosphatase [Tepidisphaeraceae bacterium]|jgi:serine phosphatase RsbU (regulator of sigma subunit)
MPPDPQRMTCMEVWGGCDAADAAVSLAGLDAWVYSRPFAQAQGGGDVYYVSSCATGRINRLLVADVSGHGAAVRDVAVQLRDLMRRYVNYIDQSKFVLSMNRQFVECSAAGCFATAVVSTFFAPTRTLSICNAGHPPPLVWRATTREWSLLDQGSESEDDRVVNIPLGIIDLEDCEQFGVELDPGDLVLVYTDSLIEARAKDGEMLGPEGLLELARQDLDPTQPQSLIPALLQSIDQRTSGGLHADDVTLLLLRATGRDTRVTWWNVLIAPVRVVASIARAIAGRGPMSLPEFSLANLGGALFSPFNRLWGRKP